ncbi:MAG: S8 family serine peptidase, partial [bacterium]
MTQVNSHAKNLFSILVIATFLTLILLISSSYAEWAYFARETTDSASKLSKAERIKNIDWNAKLKELQSRIPNSKNWPNQDQFVPDELVIKYKKNVSNAAISLKENKESLTVKKISKHLGFRVVKIPKGKSVKELVAQFAKDPDVEYAEPNFYFHIDFFPNDQYLNLTGIETANSAGWYPLGSENPPAWTDVSTGQQFNYYTYLPFTLFGMRMPSLPQPYTSYISDSGAWEITRGSSEVRVAIIDTGVMTGHEDLIDRCDRGYDYVNGDGMPLDDNGHGTHCAGIVAADIDNNRGVCGMAPEATIIPIKVLGADGSGTMADLAEGIIGAVDDFNANILSLSLGSDTDVALVRQAVEEALGKGAIIVAAAGNNGVDFRTQPHYPAAYPRVITVGSFDYQGSYSLTMQTTGIGTPILPQYTNFGYSTSRTNATDFGVEIFAPGGDSLDYLVVSTYPYDVGGTRYAPLMGTSMACPQVSGLCALLYSQGIRSVDAMTYALWSTAQSPYPPYLHGVANETTGYGVIDPRYALQFAKNFTIPAGVGFVSYTLDDDNLNGTSGNNNKLLNPGETVDISISIQNIGASNLYNVFGKLTSTDPYVSIYTAQQVQAFGDMTPGSISTSAVSFRFFVNADARSGYIIPFKLLVTDSATWNDENPAIIPFEITVFVKGPVAVSYLHIDDSSGVWETNNGNGIWNSYIKQSDGTIVSELVNISVAVHNYGVDTIYGLHMDLSNIPPTYYFGNSQFGSERESYTGRTLTDWNPAAGDLLPGHNSDTVTFQFDFVYVMPINISMPLYAYISDAEGNVWVDTVTEEAYVHDSVFYYFKNDPHEMHDDMDLSADNNNDGQINPGETIRIDTMNVKNLTGRRTSAMATLRAEQWNSVTKAYEPDPWVTITDDEIGFTRSESGGMSHSNGIYLNWLQFTVDPACPADHMIYFRLTLYGAYTTNECTFTHKVVRTRTSEIRLFYPNYTRWFDVNSHPNAIVDDINTTGFRGNFDGFLNPGETVKYIPQFNNMSWYTQFGPGYAYIVNSDPYVTIVKGTTELNPILPRGISLGGGLSRSEVNAVAFDSTSSNHYFIIQVADDCPTETAPDQHFYGYHHDFIFDTIVKDTIGREFIAYSVIPIVNSTPLSFDYISYDYVVGYSPQRVGFPLSLLTTFGNYTSGYIKTSPVVGDINNDGNDEIIVSVGTYDAGLGYVYVIDSAGNILPGWPQPIEGYIAESSPALADMNNDGILDTIVTGSGAAVGASHGRVYAWSLDGTPRTALWGAITTDRPINTTPVIADMNNDGTPEIVIGSKAWGSQSGQLYCFNTDGSLRWAYNIGGYINVAASPAVGDIDNDGKLEIVFTTNKTDPATGQPFAGNLIGLQDNDTVPTELFSESLLSVTYSAPALADLDWDGQQEIVFGTIDSTLNIYNCDGNLLQS